MSILCWFYPTPKHSSGRGKSRQNKAKNSGRDVGKQHFINSKTSVGSAFRVRVADDMTRRPLAPDLNRMSIPRNIQTQIHWFTCDYVITFSLASNAITEFNQAFSLVSCPTQFYTPISTLFDQYAIFCAYLRFNVNNSGASATSNNSYLTALDYDNSTNLGSYTALQAYGTVNESQVSEVQERYVEPCNAPALYSGGTFSHFGQARVWVDSVNTSTPHYGFRCIVAALGAGVTGQLNIEISLVVCARNSI